MPVEVQIPQVFRRHTNGARTVQAPPGTLRQVLAGLDEVYPGLRDRLLTSEGALHKFVNVYVNQEDIRFLQELETPVADGDLVTILPAVAGGTTATAGGMLADCRSNFSGRSSICTLTSSIRNRCGALPGQGKRAGHQETA